VPHGPIAQLLLITVVMAVAAVLALCLTMIALWRRPIKRRLLVIAFIVLFVPYPLVAIRFPENGIAWANQVTTDLWIIPGTAALMMVATFMRTRDGLD
jgi:hypothetical protein